MSHGAINNAYEFPPVNGEKPDSLVILLHGLGSNGQDLISLAPLWAKDLPGTAFISPDAPFACDMVPPGYPDSYQWFSLQDRDPHRMLKEVEHTAPILMDFIKAQIEAIKIPPERVVLVGFSQGTMMSLYTAPRFSQKLAGVLGYSGALIGDISGADLHKIPVCLIHGEADDVVPVAAYHHARNEMLKNGFEVSGFTVPFLAHSIDQKGLESGAAFIKKILA